MNIEEDSTVSTYFCIFGSGIIWISEDLPCNGLTGPPGSLSENMTASADRVRYHRFPDSGIEYYKYIEINFTVLQK